MRWSLLIEEYGPELVYIKVANNHIADPLNWLETTDEIKSLSEINHKEVTKDFAVEKVDLPTDASPLSYRVLTQHQNKDKYLLSNVKTNQPNYAIQAYHGGSRSQDLITFKDKIVVPSSLKIRVIEWYHTMLCHPGENCTEHSRKQSFWWHNMRCEVHKQ